MVIFICSQSLDRRKKNFLFLLKICVLGIEPRPYEFVSQDNGDFNLFTELTIFNQVFTENKKFILT